MTLVASALAGGDCVDDAPRSGGTSGVLASVVKATSTLEPSCAIARGGHIGQLGRVSRQLLAWG